MQKTFTKLDFKPFSPEDKHLYEDYLFFGGERGCEYSFANLFLWGRQGYVEKAESILFFSQFDRRTVYPFPIGKGDKRIAIDAIIEDSYARGIPCRITGMSQSEAEFLRENYPGKFRFHTDRGSFDYVYGIDDLAELKGKKYHSKKNHLNRFIENYPEYKAEPISDSNIALVEDFVNRWFANKEVENPDGDYMMEKCAIEKALKHYTETGLFGLVITSGKEALAMTIGSRLSPDTFDVHFEKARADVNGAYTVVNYEFARHIRARFPEVRYLDREEDMGIEGLRKAKESYKPHHLVEKYWAHLSEDGYDY